MWPQISILDELYFGKYDVVNGERLLPGSSIKKSLMLAVVASTRPLS